MDTKMLTLQTFHIDSFSYSVSIFNPLVDDISNFCLVMSPMVHFEEFVNPVAQLEGNCYKGKLNGLEKNYYTIVILPHSTLL